MIYKGFGLYELDAGDSPCHGRSFSMEEKNG